MFQKKVIVITGGAGGIGKCIAEEFQKQGAYVCIILRKVPVLSIFPPPVIG